jgi:hypothetical protein
MSRGRRRFNRPTGTRRIRKLILIATEGRVTEPGYFTLLNQMNPENLTVKCICGKKSTPNHVLKRIVEVLESERLKRDDEAWIVVDKDDWSDEELQRLVDWSARRTNYHLAVSNPMFEYWLLLHFEDGSGVSTANQCYDRLKRYLTTYRKHIRSNDITRDQVDDAIRRAEARDRPPTSDWPRNLGTTVYRLAKSILSA